jgi:hypothetical protein
MATFTARDTAVSLVAGTTKTIVQVVPGTNTPVRVVEIGVSFNGVTTTDVPVLVQLLRQTTAGTSSSLTLIADQESSSKSVVATGLKTFTAEPTTGNILRDWYITPIAGLFVLQFPLGREVDALTSRIALRCNAPTSAVSVNAYISFEE